MMERVLLVLMIVSSALFTGGVVFYAWDRLAVWKGMLELEYAADFRRSLRRADPTQPVLLAIWGFTTATWAIVTDEPWRELAWGTIAILILILAGSLMWAEPINNKFRRQPDGTPPPRADLLRIKWYRLHLIRTVMTMAAFACMIVAAGSFGWPALMLTTGSLFGGLAFWYAWDRITIWRSLPLPSYAADFRRSLRRADPTQPILLVTCIASGIAFTLSSGETAQRLAVLGLVGLTVILIGSVALIVPIQKTFLRQSVGTLPADAAELRGRWSVLHLARSSVALVSLSLLALASTY